MAKAPDPVPVVPDIFQLLCKASSDPDGWVHSTKALEMGGGCLIQSTTQQRNPDGSYAIGESICFVPNVRVELDKNGSRKLVTAK